MGRFFEGAVSLSVAWGAVLTPLSCGSRTSLDDGPSMAPASPIGGRAEPNGERGGSDDGRGGSTGQPERPVGYSPSSLGSRLVVWLDGTKGLMSARVVDTWLDQSGHANNA